MSLLPPLLLGITFVCPMSCTDLSQQEDGDFIAGVVVDRTNLFLGSFGFYIPLMVPSSVVGLVEA